MTHLDPLPREASPELADLFELFEAHMGFLPNSLLVMQRKPAIVRGFAALSSAVLVEADDVEPSFKQLVAHVASRAAGCQYCQAHTIHSAADAGAEQAKLDDLWTYAESDHFSEKERVALDFALAAGSVPNAVDEEVMAALSAHWTDQQIVELLSVVSLFGFLNRWNDSLATELEEVPRSAAEGTLSEHGWDGGEHVRE